MRSIVTTALLLAVVSSDAVAAKSVTGSMPVSMQVKTGATISAWLVGSEPVLFEGAAGVAASRKLGRPLFSVTFAGGERGNAHPKAVWDSRKQLFTLHF